MQNVTEGPEVTSDQLRELIEKARDKPIPVLVLDAEFAGFLLELWEASHVFMQSFDSGSDGYAQEDSYHNLRKVLSALEKA